MENSMEVPQKFKNRTTIKSSNSTPGYFSKENKRPNSKRYIHPYVHCTIFHNSQDMEATKMSIDRGVNKEDVVHTYNGILLSYKKERNNAICSNIDGPRDCHTE